MTDEPRVFADEIEQIARRLWQGDLLSVPVAPTLEARHSSFFAEAEQLDPLDEDGVWAIGAQRVATGWVAVVTQTCDAVRHPDDVPYLQLAPVVSLTEEQWEASQNGRKGATFALPAVEGVDIPFAAIDSELNFPMSKAALAAEGLAIAHAELDPADRILLSSWLMRRVGRHAFPDQLEENVLSKLRTKITHSMGKNSQAGAFCETLTGVWASTEWAAEVSIIFVVDANRIAASNTKIDGDKATDELLKPALKHLGKHNIKVQVVPTIRTLDKVSAQQLFVEHRQVEIDTLPVDGHISQDDIAALSVAADEPS